MDCRETQTLLTAFHDGELPDADRTRVENHLRDCPECGRLLADLARADEVAGVPDPGPGYWSRFNARVADRIEQEAEDPGPAVLRPKQGWMRQQLRFLVPAVAAAALVVVVVRFGGRTPVAPTSTHPPAGSVTEPSALDAAGQRTAKGEMVSPAASPPVTEPQFAAKEEAPSGLRTEKDQIALEAPPATSVGTARAKAGPSPLPSPPARAPSPCEMARTLSAQEHLREAEAAQRECLAQDPAPPTQEKGLIFLAELLDRQARFAEADEVLTEVHRQFPKSLPLTLYRQQRPTVQKQHTPAPAAR
ncbi:MAG: zf-HC2 domain-containing protein [Deltaproteobacteria bacterium]|nr:MAG: zf-HC2 domain-containing protein [Deltaproteobacteria bacterium]